MHYSREQIEAAQTPAELQAILSAAGPSSRWTVATLTEVSQFFGIATSTAKGWRMESPPMPGSDGSWPLDAIVRWRFDRLANSDLATAKKQAELESLQLQNEQRRLGLSRERGELVLLADCERWASVACVEFRECVMQLVETLSTSSPPELRDFIRAETDRHCRDALLAAQRRLELAQLREESTSGDVADDDSEPSNETESDQ